MSKHKPPEQQRRLRIPPERRVHRAKTDTSIQGRSGLNRGLMGIINEDFQRELQGQEGAENYREIADTNPVAGPMLYAVESFFTATEFPITPSVADDPVAEDAAQLMREILDDMEHPWQRVLSEFMSCPVYGHSEHQKVLKMRAGESKDPTRNSRFNDGRVGIRKLMLHNQTSISRWIFDKNSDDPDKPRGFEQFTQDGTFKVDLSRCVHFRMRENLDNPEGRSLLRNVWMPHRFLMGLYEIEAASHNRLGLGVATMEVPLSILNNPEGSVAQTLSDELASFQFNERSSMLTPAQKENGVETGFGPLKFERPQGAAGDIHQTIMRWETRVAMALMANWLMVGSDGSGGSRAMHTDKTSMFARSLTWMADMFCSTLNAQLVNPLMRLNGIPQAAWPKMTHGPVVAPSVDMFMDAVSTGVSSGVLTVSPTVETAVRRALDLPLEDLLDDGSPG